MNSITTSEPSNSGGVSESHDKYSKFYDMVMETFRTSQCLEKTLGFSLALLLRKHLMFHMYATEGTGLSADTSTLTTVAISAQGDHQNLYLRKFTPYESVDLRKFQAYSPILANALGFVNYRKAELNILNLLDQLKTFCVPENSKCDGRDLDFLVDHLGLTVCDIKGHWLENTSTCSCSPESRENEILSSVFLELLTEKISNTERCSYQVAQKKSHEISERELLCGMLRLALELWTLDYDISGFTHQCSEITPQEVIQHQAQLASCFANDSTQIPSTMQVVMDSKTGKPAVVLPKGCSWQTKERVISSILSSSKSQRAERDEDSGSNSDSDRDNEVSIKPQMLQKKLNLEFRECVDVISELNHPYIQLKMYILVHERKYPASVANKLLTWSLKPSNSVIPFEFMVFLIKKANSCGLSLILSEPNNVTIGKYQPPENSKLTYNGWCGDPFHQQQQQQQQGVSPTSYSTPLTSLNPRYNLANRAK